MTLTDEERPRVLRPCSLPRLSGDRDHYRISPDDNTRGGDPNAQNTQSSARRTPVVRWISRTIAGTFRVLSGSKELFEGVTIIRMPARKRGSVLDDISGGPGDASFIDGACYVIVGAEDIEVAQ